MKITKTALSRVQRFAREVHGDVVGTFVLETIECREGVEEYIVRDGMSFFLEQVSEGYEETGALCQFNARPVECCVSRSVRSGWRHL